MSKSRRSKQSKAARRRWGITAAAGVGVVIGLTVLAIQGMHPTPRHST